MSARTVLRQAALLLQRESDPDFIAHAIMAANDAILWACQANAWNALQKTFYVTVPSAHASAMKGREALDPASCLLNIRTIKTAFVQVDSVWCSVPVIPTSALHVWQGVNDRQISNAPRGPLVLVGSAIEYYPEPTTTAELRLHGQAWPQELTSESDENFFTTAGANWLKWAVVVSLNHRYQVFVPRQEGSLPSPVDERDLAWEALTRWDAQLVDQIYVPD